MSLAESPITKSLVHNLDLKYIIFPTKKRKKCKLMGKTSGEYKRVKTVSKSKAVARFVQAQYRQPPWGRRYARHACGAACVLVLQSKRICQRPVFPSKWVPGTRERTHPGDFDHKKSIRGISNCFLSPEHDTIAMAFIIKF